LAPLDVAAPQKKRKCATRKLKKAASHCSAEKGVQARALGDVRLHWVAKKNRLSVLRGKEEEGTF